MVKMSHVAAQKGWCCAAVHLSDSLNLCYIALEMAQFVGA
jgi:hypothetical protein